MSRLFVTVSGLKVAARRVAARSAELRKGVGEVDDLVDTLEGSFEGEVAHRYAVSIDNWVQEALALLDSVEGLGRFLNAAAKAVQDVDTQLAAALKGEGGGGISDQITADAAFLTSLSTRTGNIATELEQAERMFDGDGFSSRLISDALNGFRKGWSDARGEMVTSLRAAKEMTSAAAEVFEEADTELTKALQT